MKDILRRNLVLSNLIAYEIIQAEKKKSRPTIIAHFVKFGTFLKKLQNYHALVGCVKGLNSAPVKALKSTLAELPTQVKEEWEVLTKEEHTLKKNIKNASPPFIPPFDLFLSEVVQIEDTVPNEINGLTNLEKVFTIYQVIEPILSSINHENRFKFSPISQIQDLFDTVEYRMLTEEYLLEEANKSEQQK